MPEPSFIFGVDVGGTFTDIFVLDEDHNSCEIVKVPSRPEDQSTGILDGISKVSKNFEDISLIIHGTTVGTNALLERKGAKTGIITTTGFRDVIEMRRRDRPHTWGLWGNFEPIIPRDLRLEVDERVLSNGVIEKPVDIDQVRDAAQQLISMGVEAVCIFFMNSYANSANEKLALEAVQSVWPNDYITCASEILPEIREFERGSTSALNAYLQPIIGNYLERLGTGLAKGGLQGEVLIVQSNGGVMTIDISRSFPVRTALSGPAAGVIAGAYIGKVSGYDNLITCDMGGTSFDVSLVSDGDTALAPQTSVDFGLVVRTPMIEITTIGAGGGSIAWVDRGGLLQVGPESAGSNPGPVCYGLGNDRPTVTDANLVMGRINAERPIGGMLNSLDVEASKEAIAEHIGKPLAIEVMEAAEAVIQVANAKMAGAIRLVSIEKGHDPEKFVAMPFGGGGALHTGALIKDVGLAKAIVPRFPGITSALGCVIADMRLDRVHTLNVLLNNIKLGDLHKEIELTSKASEKIITQSKVKFERIDYVFELDMLYVGQTHSVSARLPVNINKIREELSLEVIKKSFEDAYFSNFGRLLEGIDLRILNLRVSVIGRRPKLDLHIFAPASNSSLKDAQTGERNVWVDGGWQSAKIYNRLDLPEESSISGPALLEQSDTTIFLEPDLEGSVDKLGNLIISRRE